jgi:hypothetical protein
MIDTSFDSPAARNASLARDVLERVLLDLRGLPARIDRREIVRGLEDSLSALTLLHASKLRDDDHLDRLTAVQDHVKQVREALGARDLGPRGERLHYTIRSVESALDACRAATIERVVAIQNLARDQRATGAPALDPFLASRALPRLFAVEREPIETFVDVDALERLDAGDDSPTDRIAGADDVTSQLADELARELSRSLPLLGSNDDLEGEREHLPLFFGEPEPARELDISEPGLGGEMALLERLAHDCLEEIGALGNLRVFGDETRFDAGFAANDARLLADLDALISLGEPFSSVGGGERRGIDVPEVTLAYARQVYAGDTVRPFARALVLGCIAGDDSVRAAVLGLRQSLRYAHDAQARALILASNPAVDAAMRRLAAGDDETMTAIALDVSLARVRAELAVCVPLLEHPSALVRARSAACLGVVSERQAATQLLCELLDREADDEVIVMAVEALCLQGSRAGLVALRTALADELEEPGGLLPRTRVRMLEILAVAGGARDTELLLRCYDDSGEAARALGWHGHIGGVAPLLATLAASNARIGPSTRRIVARALARIVGGPRAEPGPDGRSDRYEPPIAPEGWAAWWQENGGRFDLAVRYRFGEPHHPGAVAAELQHEAAPMRERAIGALELSVLSGGPRIDIRDWVAGQGARVVEANARLSIKDPAGTFWGDRQQVQS